MGGNANTNGTDGRNTCVLDDQQQLTESLYGMVKLTSWQSASEFKSKDEFDAEVVRHIETTLARSLFNCDEA